MEGRLIMTSRITHRYLTLAEAAEQNAVSRRTIRRWIAEGMIRGYRVGPRAIRVEADDLNQLARPIPTVGTLERQEG